METTSGRIPVTVITGFLGAGKTTLLNRFIKENRDRRFAIIENEIGEIGIDPEMVVNIGNSNIYELSNGCLCCSMNDDLKELLLDLLNSGKPFDQLLVETTGIADPAGVVQTFLSDSHVKDSFIMDSVICMVDALHFEPVFEEQEEAGRQVAIADTLLLNKAGEQDEAALQQLTAAIRSINPHCRIIKTSYADAGEQGLLDCRAYDTSRIQSYTLDVFTDGKVEEPAPGGGTMQTQHSISAKSYSLPGALDPEKFTTWIEYFLYINQSAVFRAKGILNFSGNPQKMILQSVRSSWLLEEGDYWDPGEERINRIVFAGKSLNGTEIREALENLMAS